jgi:rfaE bifunctional protein kinase chain/domain
VSAKSRGSDISYSRLKSLISRYEGKRIVVIGDVVLDVYIYGKPVRLSREAPVVVVRHDDEQAMPGGAGNAINNLVALGASVYPVAAVGSDEPGRRLHRLFGKSAADTRGVLRRKGRITPTKTRIMAGDDHTTKQQVIRIDRERTEPLSREEEKKTLSYLNEIEKRADSVLVSDYGHGFVTPSLIRWVRGVARKKAVVVDSRYNLMDFGGVTAGTPNESEAEQATGMTLTSEKEAVKCGKRIVALSGMKALLITRGNKGMVLIERSGPSRFVPIRGPSEITDVTGAGDTVAAVFAVSLAAGASYYEAAILSTYAAGVVVMKRGAATLSGHELLATIERDLSYGSAKEG